ncbi:hypothetical protein CEXT_27811 [Caerostris extrusa]|uniref:Uncharacterized protein n=1 Tax=Caerostris extrusa TaxID=172846 RepID=A0AAV4U9C5_CAEEX|nr:hypothetical protein CEXT_27811 [Caerostris extrusa]
MESWIRLDSSLYFLTGVALSKAHTRLCLPAPFIKGSLAKKVNLSNVKVCGVKPSTGTPPYQVKGKPFSSS